MEHIQNLWVVTVKFEGIKTSYVLNPISPLRTKREKNASPASFQVGGPTRLKVVRRSDGKQQEILWFMLVSLTVVYGDQTRFLGWYSVVSGMVLGGRLLSQQWWFMTVVGRQQRVECGMSISFGLSLDLVPVHSDGWCPTTAVSSAGRSSAVG